MEPWTHAEIVDLQAALQLVSFPEDLLGSEGAGAEGDGDP